jgi:hypothetical protein
LHGSFAEFRDLGEYQILERSVFKGSGGSKGGRESGEGEGE